MGGDDHGGGARWFANAKPLQPCRRFKPPEGKALTAETACRKMEDHVELKVFRENIQAVAEAEARTNVADLVVFQGGVTQARWWKTAQQTIVPWERGNVPVARLLDEDMEQV